MPDAIEAFQTATCHIAAGEYVKALPLLEVAAIAMAGDPDFESLLASCRKKVNAQSQRYADGRRSVIDGCRRL